MDDTATPASRFNELPPKTQEFLSKLEPDDIELMGEGLKLIRATLTVGRFLRWTILGLLAALVCITQFYENIAKMWGWLHPK